MNQPRSPGIYVAESAVLSARHWSPLDYFKIIGVVPEEGEPRFISKRFLDGYSWRGVTELEIKADTATIHGLTRFMELYMAGPAPGRDVPYNCHSFAHWMTGSPTNTPLTIPVSGQEVLGAPRNLAAQEPGYITDNAHSVIGLGETVPACIQVMAWNGNLGVLPYPDVAEIYGALPQPRVAADQRPIHS